MKNYNKLPFKERKRHLKYNFEQTERQEKRLIELERKRFEEEISNFKTKAIQDDHIPTDKEMQEQEVFDRLLKLVKEGEPK